MSAVVVEIHGEATRSAKNPGNSLKERPRLVENPNAVQTPRGGGLHRRPLSPSSTVLSSHDHTDIQASAADTSRLRQLRIRREISPASTDSRVPRREISPASIDSRIVHRAISPSSSTGTTLRREISPSTTQTNALTGTSVSTITRNVNGTVRAQEGLGPNTNSDGARVSSRDSKRTTIVYTLNPNYNQGHLQSRATREVPGGAREESACGQSQGMMKIVSCCPAPGWAGQRNTQPKTGTQISTMQIAQKSTASRNLVRTASPATPVDSSVPNHKIKIIGSHGSTPIISKTYRFGQSERSREVIKPASPHVPQSPRSRVARPGAISHTVGGLVRDQQISSVKGQEDTPENMSITTPKNEAVIGADSGQSTSSTKKENSGASSSSSPPICYRWGLSANPHGKASSADTQSDRLWRDGRLITPAVDANFSALVERFLGLPTDEFHVERNKSAEDRGYDPFDREAPKMTGSPHTSHTTNYVKRLQAL